MSTTRSFSPDPLGALGRALRGLQDLAVGSPRATLWVAILLAVGLASQIPRMRILLSLNDLVEGGLPSTARSRELKEVFAGGNTVGLILAPAEGVGTFTAPDIDRIHSWITRQESENGALARTTSPFDLHRLSGLGSSSRSRPLLARGTPEELRALADTPWGGILTDRAGRDIGVEFAFRDTPGGSRYGAFDPAVVGLLAGSCAGELGRDGRVESYVTGPGAFQYYALEGIRRFRILNLLVLVLILVALRVLLGTWLSGVMLVGVLVSAGVAVYGAMSLAGAPIDFLSTGLFLVLSVAALEDFLFLSHEQLSRGTEWRPLFRNLLVPGFFTSLTTVIGFGSLGVSDLAIIRRFGLWAAVGSSLEWVATFLVLPAFIALVPRCRSWTDPKRAWQPALLGRLVRYPLPRRAGLMLLAVYVLGAAGALRMESSDSIAGLFPDSHPYRRSLEYVEASRGWMADMSVVFPEAWRRDENQRVIAELAAHPNVAQVLDPYAAVDFATGGRSDEFLVGVEIGVTAPGKLGALFSPDGAARAILYLKDISLEATRGTVRAAEKACRGAGCHPAGDLAAFAEFAAKVPAALFGSFGTSLLLVGLVLAGLLRLSGTGRTLPVLAATFWGPACMMAVLWILRVPLTFLTCVFASVLVGLAGDNTIQFLAARGEGSLTEGMDRRGGAALLVVVVMSLACLVFLGSSFVPSRRLGVLLAAGFVASLFGDVWILRGLLEPPRGGR